MATIFYSASYRISGPETAAEGADTVEFHISTPSIRVTDEDVAAIDLADASETRDQIIGVSLWCATPSHRIDALAMLAAPVPTATGGRPTDGWMPSDGIRLAARIACGPKSAPGRFVTTPS